MNLLFCSFRLCQRGILINDFRYESRIMNPTHANGIAHLIISVHFHTFCPIFLNYFPVFSGKRVIISDILIVFFLQPWSPFILVAAKQHITMRCSNNNPHFLSQSSVFRVTVKVIHMHGRPDIVCF